MNFRIREARIAANLTQEQLAKKLGIKNSTLSGYEIGAHDPKSNTLVEIARICNTTTDYLLGLDLEAEEKPVTVDGLTDNQERFIWLYRQLGEDGIQLIDSCLSLSPSNRRIMIGLAKLLLQEQAPPSAPPH